MPVPTAMIPAILPRLVGNRAIPDPRVKRPVKLGRRRPPGGLPVVHFARYLDRGRLTIPPPSVRYEDKAQPSLARMYANDRLGDCVIASKAHQVGVWTGNDDTAGPATPAEFPDAKIESTYSNWCGPGDNGCVIRDVLDRWMSEGFPSGSGAHPIDGYAAIDPTDATAVMTAIHLFGGVCFGLEYLDAWQSQSVPDGVWDDVPGSSLGGHDVLGCGYDLAKGVRIATWGYVQWLTWAACKNPRIVEECYVILGRDWYSDDRLSPAGIDVDGLRAALAVFQAGRVPADPPPSPSPPVPVPPVPVPTPPAPGGGSYTVSLSGTGRAWWGTEEIEMSGTVIPGPAAGAQQFSDQECDRLGIPPARRELFRSEMARRGPAGAPPEQGEPAQAGGQQQLAGTGSGFDWSTVGQLLLQLLLAVLGQLANRRPQSK